MIKTYLLKEHVWLYPGKVGWYFITIPKKTTEEIDYFFSHVKRGWGSLPVKVTTGKTSWQTSIFPDKKTGTYFLPLKAVVRTKEKVSEKDLVIFSIEIED